MTAVAPYPPIQRFGGPSHRALAPAVPRASSFYPDIFRDMTFPPPNYFPPPGLPRPSSDGRSTSVSSTSSSVSHGTTDTHHRPNSRTMSSGSLAGSVASDPACGLPVLARGYNTTASNHQSYPSQTLPSHQQPYATQTQSSSLYLQAQVAPQMPLYAQIPAPRPYAQTTSFGYQMSSLPAQPSPLSFQTYSPLYPSFATPGYQSSSATVPSYHAIQSMPMIQLQEEDRPSILERMPPEILKILKRDYLGYLDITILSGVSRWCRAEFDPTKCSEDDKIAGVRDAERYFKRYFPGKVTGTSGGSRSGRESDLKIPGSFGCYHCYRVLGPENFELFKWNNPSQGEDGNGSDTDSTMTSSSNKKRKTQDSGSPSSSSSSPSMPTSNPHYDPSITRSSIQASNRARKSTPEDSGASPRIKNTWGTRRFCIQCGIAKRFYVPGDLIELYVGRNEAIWVCRCMRTHIRPLELNCRDCNSYIPLSQPSRRRG
ncbi:hypothetical protein B0T22DRAFT_86976 [Podospora appendiculata]|uniref:Uncharacterized protein n=1 Tax=Podospora appendiculata TaxID=314037 RepID=A0AAE0XKZ5_9PEZI|nr:hypothetical protein B0T22DRAFT_86976 [Podospora appendiculata]